MSSTNYSVTVAIPSSPVKITSRSRLPKVSFLPPQFDSIHLWRMRYLISVCTSVIFSSRSVEYVYSTFPRVTLQDRRLLQGFYHIVSHNTYKHIDSNPFICVVSPLIIRRKEEEVCEEEEVYEQLMQLAGTAVMKSGHSTQAARGAMLKLSHSPPPCLSVIRFKRKRALTMKIRSLVFGSFCLSHTSILATRSQIFKIRNKTHNSRRTKHLWKVQRLLNKVIDRP